MHESTKRLYSVLHEIGAIKGNKIQSEVAKFLNKSSQLINNWEERGISDKGLLEIQYKTGCSAIWIQTGRNPKFIGDSTPIAIDELENELLISFKRISSKEKKRQIIGYINGLLDGHQKSGNYSIPKNHQKKTA